MNELQSFAHYSEFKREMDASLSGLADNVVRVGHLLKQARDTEILRESGYKSVAEFAKTEYNMSPDAVSRYIRINDRFSEGGNSARLDSRFCSFGYTKLADMLALPDKLAADIPAEATREEIRELVREVKEEQEVTELELRMEMPQAPEVCLLDRVLREAARRDVRLFTGLCAAADIGSQRDVYETLAPTGVTMSMVRIPGVGRMALTVKSLSEPIALTNVRENSRTDVAWDEALAAVRRVFAGSCPEEIYRRLYDAELPQPWTETAEEAAAEETETEPAEKNVGKTAGFAPAQKQKDGKKNAKPQKKPERGKTIRIASARETAEESKPASPAAADTKVTERKVAETEHRQDAPAPAGLEPTAETEAPEETNGLSELLEQLNRIRVRILSHNYTLAQAAAHRMIQMLEEQIRKEMEERENELKEPNAAEDENKAGGENAASGEVRSEAEATVGTETASI